MQLLSFPIIYGRSRRMLTHILYPHDRRKLCELLEAQHALQRIHTACGVHGAPAPIVMASVAAAPVPEKNPQALIFL